MTENEYILLTNKVKVSAAYSLLTDCIRGKEYGIMHQEFKTCIKNLNNILNRLESMTPVDCRIDSGDAFF